MKVSVPEFCCVWLPFRCNNSTQDKRTEILQPLNVKFWVKISLLPESYGVLSWVRKYLNCWGNRLLSLGCFVVITVFLFVCVCELWFTTWVWTKKVHLCDVLPPKWLLFAVYMCGRLSESASWVGFQFTLEAMWTLLPPTGWCQKGLQPGLTEVNVGSSMFQNKRSLQFFHTKLPSRTFFFGEEDEDDQDNINWIYSSSCFSHLWAAVSQSLEARWIFGRGASPSLPPLTCPGARSLTLAAPEAGRPDRVVLLGSIQVCVNVIRAV